MFPAALTRIEFDDPGVFASALTNADVHCLQTSPGALKLQLSILRTAGLELHLTAMPVGSCLALGRAADSLHSFHVPLTETPRLSIMGRRMEDGLMAHYSRGGEMAVNAECGARLAYIVPDPDAFAAIAGERAGRAGSFPETQGIVATHSKSCVLALQGCIDEIWRLVDHEPDVLGNGDVARHLEQMLLERLSKAVFSSELRGASPGRTPLSRQAIMKRVDDYLRLKSSEPVYVSELCGAAGVSQPTLFRAFFDVLGLSPKQYLQIRRLHLARDRLLHDGSPALTVSSVAYDCGFWQLGRFGQAYRKLFSEAPSQTLKRARGTAAQVLVASGAHETAARSKRPPS